MGDMLQDGSDWLAAQLKAYVAQTVTYTRQAQALTLKATLGTSLLKTTDGRGNTRTERTEADFIFTAADLDFGAGPVKPQRGDTITLAGVTYEAMPYGKDEPVYRPEPGGASVRVHTRYRSG